MPLIDLGKFLDDDALTIPGVKSTAHPKGKTYVIKSPDAETGLWLSGLATLGARVANGDLNVTEEEVRTLQMDDRSERNFVQTVLGETYDEMVADGVSWVTLQRLGQYVFAYFAMSPEAARQGVESGAFEGKARTKQQPKTTTAAKSRRSPASAGSSKGTTSSKG